MIILKRKSIVNSLRSFSLLFSFFCLNTNIYSIDNKDLILNDRVRDLEYFTNLMEFASGLLIILCLALATLLIISAGKNRRKDRLLDHYETDHSLTLQNGSPAKVKQQSPGVAGTSVTESSNEQADRKIASLEKELNILRNKLEQEQELRRKMENEIADLLSRMKRN